MSPPPSLHDAAERYWSALLTGDAEAAFAAVRAAIDDGADPPRALDEIVVAGQHRIGDHWAAAQWTVGQEHAATAISAEVVARVASELPPHDPGRPRMLVVCADREAHTLAAEVVAVSLYAWGWPTEVLGPGQGRAELLLRLGHTRPAAVLVSASLGSALPRVARQVADVTAVGIPVIVGGAAFGPVGRRAERLGASGHAPTPEHLHDLLDRLPTLPIEQAPAPHPEAVQLAAEADAVARDVLEATERGLGGGAEALGPDHWRVVLATSTPHLVAAVAGGIVTDDPEVPRESLDWLDRALRRRSAPAGVADLLFQGLRQRLGEYPAARSLLG